MNLTSKPLAAIILVILFGGIAFTTAMGWWATESSKVAATYTEGEFAGQANPAAFAAKELETIYAESEFEVGTASVRLFVAFYNGLPFDLTTDMYLPESAAILLKEKNLTPEQSAYLESHTVPNAAPASDSPEVDPAQTAESAPEAEPTQSAATTESSTEERLVKGKTSFQEVLDWGVSQEIIEQIMGMPMPNPLTKIKDFCLEKGLDFEAIKVALQAEVDKVKQ